MQYILLIYSDETKDARRSDEQNKTLMEKYFAFNAEAKAAGVFVGGDALMPTATATTVRMEGDKPLNVDGPFAESKEALGGYYLLDCKDLDEALHWAAKCPALTHGAIEVRPVVDFSQET